MFLTSDSNWKYLSKQGWWMVLWLFCNTTTTGCIFGFLNLLFYGNMLFLLSFTPYPLKHRDTHSKDIGIGRITLWTFANHILFFSRLPFSMLVLQKAVKLVWNLPKVMRVAYAFMLVMLLWMAIWSFGASGVVASSIGDSGRWWLLVVSWQVLLFIPSVFVGSRTAGRYHLKSP